MLRASAPLGVSVHLVTKLYEVTLQQVVRAQSLHVSQRKHLLVSVCRGLAYMHSCGVVHRDIKPGNILVNNDLTCVIGDLGFARHLPKGGSTLRHGTRSGACTIVADDGKALSEYVVTRWCARPRLSVAPPHVHF